MASVFASRIALVATILVVAGCGGAGSGLLATVPPPVEFAGLRAGGVNELPAAGSYSGTLQIDRVTYRYDREEGEWTLTASDPVQAVQRANATVGVDGSITLRAKGDDTTFTGDLKVSTEALEPKPTVTLKAPDGTSALYPYVLRNGEPRTLTIYAHGQVDAEGTDVLSFARYWFEVSPSP